jgi:hypothetical protein
MLKKSKRAKKNSLPALVAVAAREEAGLQVPPKKL